MSTKDFLEKDYYKTLGVAKGASADEIKKSYRKLARKYHPDANEGDAKAEERFKEISEAYNVLSDEKRRKEYDEARTLFGGGPRMPGSGGTGGGYNFDLGDLFGNTTGAAGSRLGDLLGGVFGRGGGTTTQQARPRRGADVETETSLSFSDSIEGATVSLRLTGEGPCKSCMGTGAKAGTVPALAPVPMQALHGPSPARCSDTVAPLTASPKLSDASVSTSAPRRGRCCCWVVRPPNTPPSRSPSRPPVLVPPADPPNRSPRSKL